MFVGRSPTWESRQSTKPNVDVRPSLRFLNVDFEHLVVAGGDGTIHNVVNELFASDRLQTTTLHLLPCGSANDYAYSLRRATTAGNTIAADLAIAVSDGQKRAFCNVMGIGLTARVAARMQNIRRSKPYLLSLLQTLARNRRPSRFCLELDKQPSQRSSFLTFSIGIGMREGGFVTLPNARIKDGQIDYFWLLDAPLMKVVRALPALARGRLPHLEEIRTGRCASSRIVCEQPQPVHLDGELWLERTSQIEVSILPSALRVGYISLGSPPIT